jgi:uncharacterized membrane protein YeaQ/YmgE (transglycosylase-associated protein family)
LRAQFVLVATIDRVAGWLADAVMEGGGYGVIGDVVLGVAGSIAGVRTLRALGFEPSEGWMAIVGAAFVGAVVLIYTQRMAWHKKA